MKQCKNCGKWFLPEDVSQKGLCRICVRDYDWRRRRNITPEEYAQLFNKQEGKCAICHKNYKDEKQMFAVDHDHITGAVRGLLCKTCNLGLGFFADDYRLLLNAANYIKKGLNIEDENKDLMSTIETQQSIIESLKDEVGELKNELEFIRKSF